MHEKNFPAVNLVAASLSPSPEMICFRGITSWGWVGVRRTPSPVEVFSRDRDGMAQDPSHSLLQDN
jgi:hypothetical protein